LGDEKAENGGMLILPGSHRWDVSADALDEAQFLIAHCFHAAGKNTTDKQKYSLVFTYHGEDTKALLNTKSSTLPPILLASD